MNDGVYQASLYGWKSGGQLSTEAGVLPVQCRTVLALVEVRTFSVAKRKHAAISSTLECVFRCDETMVIVAGDGMYVYPSGTLASLRVGLLSTSVKFLLGVPEHAPTGWYL